jgi:hypothetical protein
MTSTALATGKLGKLSVRTDVRTLRLRSYVDPAVLPTPPDSIDLTAHVGEWPMYANDKRGDCTTAAAGHMIEAWTAAAAGQAVEVSEDAVVRAFDAVRVTDPLTGEEGAIELDVLRYWRKRGIGGHRIGAYAAVGARDHYLTRTAAWLFGGLYIGLSLPASAQRQETWDWTGSLSGDAKPGSWGGHAVDVVRLDADALTVVTWGRLQLMTWTFWDRYCDESYCILSTDFLREGRAPNGFDLAALKTDLELITAP